MPKGRKTGSKHGLHASTTHASSTTTTTNNTNAAVTTSTATTGSATISISTSSGTPQRQPTSHQQPSSNNSNKSTIDHHSPGYTSSNHSTSSPLSSAGVVAGTTTTTSTSDQSHASSLQQTNQNQNYNNNRPITLYRWLLDHGGIYYLFIFMIFGFTIGFLCGNVNNGVPGQELYSTLMNRITHAPPRSTTSTAMSHSFMENLGQFVSNPLGSIAGYILSIVEDRSIPSTYYEDPTDTRIFPILREAIVREPGGYVHRDLGIFIPAPCGSIRGLGMIRNAYYHCQRECFTNNPQERIEVESQQQQQQQQEWNITHNSNSHINHDTTSTRPSHNDEVKRAPTYRQDEILIRIPLSYQMTRSIAMETFRTLIPEDVQVRSNMLAYDDSMYLTLFLAHERGVGQYSKWLPYIASLPTVPTCGYSQQLRPYMLNAIEAYRVEWDVDTNGWGEELYKALIYAERIVDNLETHFSSYIETPPGMTSRENLQWALCQVVSRGIAGSSIHGSLRLVPVVDLINHDADAAGIVELDGTERIQDGDFLDAISELDNGTFVIRSMRYGRLRALRQGQELMVNYNVPYYTPLDWFVYSGFVPPERCLPWYKMDAVIPPVRRDGPFAFATGDAEGHYKRKEERLLQYIKEVEASL
jgi:hypothetical protein